ncbi:MAG: hypothetical protein ACOY0T_10065 [Myxococcota bacterium]
MSEVREPKRLFESEGTPEALRDWLERAQRDTSSAEQIADIVRSVEHLAQAPEAHRLSSERRIEASPAGNGAGWLSAKGLLVLSLLAAGGAVWFGWPRQTLAPKHDAAVAPTHTAALVHSSAAEVSEPAEIPALVGTASSPPQTSAPPAALPQTSEPAAATSSRAPRAVATPEKPNSERTPRTSETASNEFQLLRAARQALATNPARALALTDEHARSFPRGMLIQEREAIAIESLARVGRQADAKLRAQRFLQRFPASPYAKRVEAAVPSAPRN